MRGRRLCFGWEGLSDSMTGKTGRTGRNSRMAPPSRCAATEGRPLQERAF